MRILIVIAMLACIFLLSGCFKELPLSEVQKCEFDSDCIQVYTAGCCKCPLIINSNYSEYWTKLEKNKKSGCTNAVCELCGPKIISTACLNNTCIPIYSPVGMTI